MTESNREVALDGLVRLAVQAFQGLRQEKYRSNYPVFARTI
jgi:hypothetical protein